MEHSKNFIAPEASTDERASSPEPQAANTALDWPEFATREEAAAFWQGVKRGVRESGRDLSHPHLPADFALNLTRDGAESDLTSGKPLDVWPHNPDDANNHGNTSHGPVTPLRADRHDGFTHAAEQLFLRTLADTGVVADACRATGLTRQAAYARRHSAAGRAFALAWDAALLLARSAIADDVMGRSRHGVIERVYRNGELVAERHKYDNRLTMAVLARLDRLAEGQGEGAPVARAIAQEFDQFLATLPAGLEAAERFVAARFPAPDGEGEPQAAEEPAGPFGDPPPSGSEAALLARLAHFGERGVGLPIEIDIDDLDPEEMADWNDAQWDRAKASGLLALLTADEWPDAARDGAAVGSADGTDGICQMRQHYRRYHPADAAAPAAPEDDFGGCSVWEADDGEWLTDFPPPPGFDGYEEGEPGGWGYKRELAPEEQAIIDADLARERAKEDERLPDLEAARRRYFELDEPEEQD